MAENRYNVDDILREVKEKRAREERTDRPEGRREATTPEELLRQLDAAQAGVRKTAAPTSKPRPTPAKRTEPVKKTEPSPAELLRKAEKPAEPEFLWEEPQQQEPVVQPEEWTLPEAEEPQPTEPERPAAGVKAPAGRENGILLPGRRPCAQDYCPGNGTYCGMTGTARRKGEHEA